VGNRHNATREPTDEALMSLGPQRVDVLIRTTLVALWRTRADNHMRTLSGGTE
jgi:hypothetical protein